MSPHKHDLHQGNIRYSRKSPMKPLYPFLASNNGTPPTQACDIYATHRNHQAKEREYPMPIIIGGPVRLSAGLALLF